MIRLVLICLCCLSTPAATLHIGGPRFVPSATEPVVGPPLDAVTNIAFAAYSVSRKLRAAYAGNCLRVRRSSDSTEQDIGFVTNAAGNVVLDAAAIATFCSGTDGFIVTIYDQSANALNITQATAGSQPKIASSGVVLVGASYSRARADFDGTDDLLTVTRTQALPVTYLLVASSSTFVSSDILVRSGSTSRCTIKQVTSPNRYRANSGVNLDDTTTIVTGAFHLIAAYFESGTSDSIGVDAGTKVVGTAGDTSVTSLTLGDPTLSADFDFQEWLCFPTAVVTADETILRNNANSFYALF